MLSHRNLFAGPFGPNDARTALSIIVSPQSLALLRLGLAEGALSRSVPWGASPTDGEVRP